MLLSSVRILGSARNASVEAGRARLMDVRVDAAAIPASTEGAAAAGVHVGVALAAGAVAFVICTAAGVRRRPARAPGIGIRIGGSLPSSPSLLPDPE
jgi:hypothetical protein